MLLEIIPLNEFIDVNKRPAIERTGIATNRQVGGVRRETRENTELYTRARAIFYRVRRGRGFRASAIF